MELVFNYAKTPKNASLHENAIREKVLAALEKHHEKLKKEGTKGIVRVFKPENYVFVFEKKNVVVLPSAKGVTLLKFFELVGPKLKNIKVNSDIELNAPEIVSKAGDTWEASKKITLEKGKKWSTLEHNGLYLLEPYIPHNLPLWIDGKKVKVNDYEEEILYFYGKQIASEEANENNTKYTHDMKFVERFWADAQNLLEPSTIKKMKPYVPKKASKDEFQKFNSIFKYFVRNVDVEKEAKKQNINKTKESNVKIERKYQFAIVDGRKEKIANYKAEIPSLFKGRGDSPNRGCIKARIRSKDVTINIGKEAKIPIPSDNGKWGEVKHDQEAGWLASWKEACSKKTKYMELAPTSKIKGMSDMAKYEKARKLSTLIDSIVAKYTKDMKSSDLAKKQLGTVLYLIDNYAFRVGNEKAKDETDTVGATTLKVSNISLSGGSATFDFLGKDSIQYKNTIKLDDIVYDNLKLFTKGKKPNDELFDRISSADVNTYLKGFMKGLTAKVFRTYRASTRYFDELQKIKKNLDVDDKLMAEKDANREVAKVCNHQKKVSAKAEITIENLKNKLAEIKKDYASKKKAKSLTDKQKAAFETRIKKAENNIITKSNNLDIACGTSKQSYIDPRIVVAWSEKNDVPLSKIYSKALLAKFNWAITTTSKDWNYKKSPIELIESEDKSPKKKTASKKKDASPKKKPAKKKDTITDRHPEFVEKLKDLDKIKEHARKTPKKKNTSPKKKPAKKDKSPKKEKIESDNESPSKVVTLSPRTRKNIEFLKKLKASGATSKKSPSKKSVEEVIADIKKRVEEKNKSPQSAGKSPKSSPKITKLSKRPVKSPKKEYEATKITTRTGKVIKKVDFTTHPGYEIHLNSIKGDAKKREEKAFLTRLSIQAPDKLQAFLDKVEAGEEPEVKRRAKPKSSPSTKKTVRKTRTRKGHTVPELKELAKDRGIKTTGMLKQDLLDALGLDE